MKKVSYICFILWMLSITIIQAKEVTKAGTTAAGFLVIDVGARAVGMGGAFVSLADDATAMFWNPAGISRFERPMTSFSHMRWGAEISINCPCTHRGDYR